MNRKNKLYSTLMTVLITVMLAGWLAGCGVNREDPAKEDSPGNLRVVTTTSILADLTKNILGDRGTVTYLVPRGENPEDYELLPGQFQEVSQAHLLIFNGLGLEEPIRRSVKQVTQSPLVEVTRGIEPIPLAGEDAPDPHAWLDVKLVRDKYLENIWGALVGLDPEGASLYGENTRHYAARLEELDQWLHRQVETIPEKNRVIILSENAFKYFGESYGFQTEGIWELNSHEEGTPRQISRIVNLVEEKELPALFIETTVDRRFMETVSRETGVPVAGEVYTDALGPPGSGAETYLDMMRHNGKTIARCLGE